MLQSNPTPDTPAARDVSPSSSSRPPADDVDAAWAQALDADWKKLRLAIRYCTEACNRLTSTETNNIAGLQIAAPNFHPPHPHALEAKAAENLIIALCDFAATQFAAHNARIPISTTPYLQQHLGGGGQHDVDRFRPSALWLQLCAEHARTGAAASLTAAAKTLWQFFRLDEAAALDTAAKHTELVATFGSSNFNGVRSVSHYSTERLRSGIDAFRAFLLHASSTLQPQQQQHARQVLDQAHAALSKGFRSGDRFGGNGFTIRLFDGKIKVQLGPVYRDALQVFLSEHRA